MDHNPWTQSRIPMEVLRDGESVRRFQALQQCSVMSPWSVKMRFDSQLSRMIGQMFSAGEERSENRPGERFQRRKVPGIGLAAAAR